MKRYQQSTYVPATPPPMTHPGAETITGIVAASQAQHGPQMTVHAPTDVSGAYASREGIVDKTSAADRAVAGVQMLIPFVLSVAFFVIGLVIIAKTDGGMETAGIALTVVAAASFALYAYLVERHFAHSRPGVERLRIHSAERTETRRMDHIADLERMKMSHEHALADKALGAYVTALLGDGHHEG